MMTKTLMIGSIVLMTLQSPVVGQINLPFTDGREGYTGPITITWDANWNMFRVDNWKPKCTTGATSDCKLMDGTTTIAENYWTLTREVLPGTQENSLSYYMFYLFEKYFVAMPQFYGWFYLQRFFGLQEWCDLQKDKFPSGNDVYKYECFQFAFVFKTLYLLWISSFLLA